MINISYRVINSDEQLPYSYTIGTVALPDKGDRLLFEDSEFDYYVVAYKEYKHNEFGYVTNIIVVLEGQFREV